MGAWIGPAVTAAVISSIIAAVGWYVSWHTARSTDDRRRQEKIRDVQTAILAEIRSIVHHLQQYDAATLYDAIAGRMAEDESYLPFIAREAGSPLFSAIASDIAILPNAVIDPVVVFYRQIEAVAYFAEDLRSERFVAVSNKRKLDIIKDYLAMRDYALHLGLDAKAALEASLAEPINRSDGDLSGRKSASGGA